MKVSHVAWILGLSISTPLISFAEEVGNTVPVASASPSMEGEEMNVDALKEKYWARGNETELGVVQNRAYSKRGKVEFSLLFGALFSDPFLNIYGSGFTLGYHINEFLSLHFLGFKDFVSASAALTSFQEMSSATANTNNPQYYLGSEFMASIFYGKLSVLGKKIIYYDFYLLGGLGSRSTESGKYLTETLGLGQRFYLNQVFSVRLDYRLMMYYESILEKQISTKLGQVAGSRENFTHSVALEFSIMPFGI